MTQKQVMIVSTLLIFILTPILLAQDLPPEILGYADLVLYNGRILTMDRDQTPINVLEAVAVRDGRILATGETDRMLRMAGPDTIRVDLGGKAVIPGIVDTHSHPNSYAARHYRQEITPPYVRYMEENRIRFATVRWESKEAALSDFKTVADSLPSDYWIFATSGLNAAVLEELSRYDLDEVVPDHPVYVRIGNAQYVLANSKILEIISETYGGKILPGMYTDEQGVPNGRIFGAAGTMIDQEIIPSIPPEILAPPFKKELEEWVAIGVTTLSTRLRGNELTAYGLLDRNGELPLRLGYSHEIGRGNPFLERALKRFGNLQGHGTDRLWMIGITIGIPDGTGPGASSGGGRVCVSMPKREVLPLDFWPDGMCHWDQPGDPGADTVVVANRYGYRVSGVHTFGDKAYLMMLDAYEQADQENPVRGRRFALDHGSMVPPEVVRKSAELGVTWSIQVPMFYSRDPRVISRVWGEEYAHT